MRANSAKPQLRHVSLKTLGFCVDKAGEAELLADGVEHIWMRGRQAESLDWAIDFFRGEPGVLKVANDLRCLGPTRKEIFAYTADLTRRERNEVAPEWLLRNLVDELGAKRTAALLENKISASSLGRHYGAAR